MEEGVKYSKNLSHGVCVCVRACACTDRLSSITINYRVVINGNAAQPVSTVPILPRNRVFWPEFFFKEWRRGGNGIFNYSFLHYVFN